MSPAKKNNGRDIKRYGREDDGEKSIIHRRWMSVSRHQTTDESRKGVADKRRTTTSFNHGPMSPKAGKNRSPKTTILFC